MSVKSLVILPVAFIFISHVSFSMDECKNQASLDPCIWKSLELRVWESAKQGDLEEVKRIISGSSSCTIPFIVGLINEGKTALDFAVKHKDAAMAWYLFRKGAKFNYYQETDFIRAFPAAPVSSVTFNESLYSIPVQPLVQIKVGDGMSRNDTYREMLAKFKNVRPPNQFVKIQSSFNQAIWKTDCLPTKSVHRLEKVYDNFPLLEIQNGPYFSFIDALNGANIALPKDLFLEQKNQSSSDTDSSLSQKGLELLAKDYAQTSGMKIFIMRSSEEFEAAISEIKRIAENKPVACFVNVDPAARHITGIYFDNINNQVCSFIFDTMGLTLPAYPCGLRGYHHNDYYRIINFLSILEKNTIPIGIMPINTVLRLQYDRFSCLIATVLFFEGMRDHKFQLLESLGMVACYGEPGINNGNLLIESRKFKVFLY